MKLTPLDIRHKEFKRGMRGYADVEVDEFLDQVADEYERLFKENIDLQDRVEALEDKVAGYKRIEETLQKTLVNAQASAEEQKQNANKQAQLVLQDAELKARQLVNEAYSERQAIEQSLAKLRSAEEDFRFKFRQLLEGYQRQLQETPEVTEARAGPRTSRGTRRPSRRRSRASPRRSVPRRPRQSRSGQSRRDRGRGRAREPDAAPADPDAGRSAPERSQPRQPVPDAPAVAPARGHGGIQAGVHEAAPRPAARAGAGGHDGPAGPTGRSTIPAPRRRSDDSPPRERVQFGESDDLLADVDTGVNENEFKW